MSIAPEPILRAGNDTVSRACVFCRNQTLHAGASIRLVNELMEAIHEVPRMLMDWERHSLTDLRIHLACFRAAVWPGAPDLLEFFEQRLSDFGYDEPAA